VPIPPALPRHLDKVILNTTPKELEGTVGGTAGDDNSILPVPNHVVLNHLTAAAIKNGTLAVGTTTRYKRKVRMRCTLTLVTSLFNRYVALPVHHDGRFQACWRPLTWTHEEEERFGKQA
jgi:hypothetical protein